MSSINEIELASDEETDLKFGIDDAAEQDDLKAGTFASVAQAYLDALEVKDSTRKSYRQLLQNYWMPELQHRNVWNIELPILRRISREIDWTSHKVRKNATSVLRQVFTFAVDDGYRTDNPAAKLTIKREKATARKPDPYTAQERDTLLAWLEANTDAHVYAYFLTAFYTGMRTGELLALTWADVSSGALNVDKARVQGKLTRTKTDQARTVLIPAGVAKVIARLPSRFKAAEVFVNQYGRHYQAGYHLVQAFMKAHDATGTRRSSSPNYPWRHTYASIGLTSGADHGWLAKQLGHSLQMFYTVYADWIDTAEADARNLAKIS